MFYTFPLVNFAKHYLFGLYNRSDLGLMSYWQQQIYRWRHIVLVSCLDCNVVIFFTLIDRLWVVDYLHEFNCWNVSLIVFLFDLKLKLTSSYSNNNIYDVASLIVWADFEIFIAWWYNTRIDCLHWMPYLLCIYWRSDRIHWSFINNHWLRQ